jgi:hypothetical protein
LSISPLPENSAVTTDMVMALAVQSAIPLLFRFSVGHLSVSSWLPFTPKMASDDVSGVLQPSIDVKCPRSVLIDLHRVVDMEPSRPRSTAREYRRIMCIDHARSWTERFSHSVEQRKVAIVRCLTAASHCTRRRISGVAMVHCTDDTDRIKYGEPPLINDAIPRSSEIFA